MGTGDLEAPRALTGARLEPGTQPPGVPCLHTPARGCDLAALSPLASSSVLTKTASGEEGAVGEATGRRDSPGLQRRVPGRKGVQLSHRSTSLSGRELTSLQLLATVKYTRISPYHSLGKRILSGGSQVGQLSQWLPFLMERDRLLDQVGLSLPRWVPNQSQGRRNLKGPRKDPRITLLCPRRLRDHWIYRIGSKSNRVLRKNNNNKNKKTKQTTKQTTG